MLIAAMAVKLALVTAAATIHPVHLLLFQPLLQLQPSQLSHYQPRWIARVGAILPILA
jgi:hypothetical protein